MLETHKLLGTWQNLIHTYIALTAFAREEFIKGGLPASKIVVKPNFFDVDPGTKQGMGDYALFLGRFSAEKGVSTMIRELEGITPKHSARLHRRRATARRVGAKSARFRAYKHQLSWA